MVVMAVRDQDRVRVGRAHCRAGAHQVGDPAPQYRVSEQPYAVQLDDCRRMPEVGDPSGGAQVASVTQPRGMSSTVASRRPNTNAFGISTTGASVTNDIDCTRRTSSSKNTRISNRASPAPRQKWVPTPKARWSLGCRVTSKREGSSKWDGSRLAEPYISTTCWPARIVTPPSS